jgi:hypothetical protein
MHLFLSLLRVSANMSLKPEQGGLAEKHADAAPAYEPGVAKEHTHNGHYDTDPDMVEVSQNRLHTDLKSRHMQMIAMQVDSPPNVFVDVVLTYATTVEVQSELACSSVQVELSRVVDLLLCFLVS